MTAAVAPAAMSGMRERWRMGAEARALLLVTACLLVFGLAVLYSASALAVFKDGVYENTLFTRQLSGALVGGVLFALASKIDAEWLRKLGWPVMIISILLMLVTVLPFTQSLAPSLGGSRRFIRGSIQPSELAKLAVVIWTSMLLVKKGDAVRRVGQRPAPIPVRDRNAERVGGARTRLVDCRDVLSADGALVICSGRPRVALCIPGGIGAPVGDTAGNAASIHQGTHAQLHGQRKRSEVVHDNHAIGRRRTATSGPDCRRFGPTVWCGFW